MEYIEFVSSHPDTENNCIILTPTFLILKTELSIELFSINNLSFNNVNLFLNIKYLENSLNIDNLIIEKTNLGDPYMSGVNFILNDTCVFLDKLNIDLFINKLLEYCT